MGKAKTIIDNYSKQETVVVSENLSLNSKQTQKLKTLLDWINTGAKKNVIEEEARELYAELFIKK